MDHVQVLLLYGAVCVGVTLGYVLIVGRFTNARKH